MVVAFLREDIRHMRHLFCAAILAAMVPHTAHAYLGGFEPADGYVDVNSHLKPGAFPDYDVAKYNAGQFGANVDPLASYSQVTPPSRLWAKTLGTLMPSSANSSPAHTYVTSHTMSGTFPYILKPHSGVRALLVTTNNLDAGKPVWNSGLAQAYSYNVDSHDLQGMNPALTGNQKVQLSFWSCSRLWGTGDNGTIGTLSGGLPAGTIGNTVSFRDGQGDVAFTLGYRQPATTTDFAWTSLGGQTNVQIDGAKWHRWDVTLDLVANRVSADLTPELSPGVLGAKVNVLSNVALPANFDALSSLEFTSSAGENNAKFWALDDFEFCVTEAPLSALLSGGVLCSGDKKFSDFNYHGGGDMPPAEDIYVKAITDADGNFGIRFQGAFVDAFGGGASDALIDYKVTAPAGKLIKDVHLGANPLVIGGDGSVSVTETFLGSNDQVVLSAYDLEPGGRKLTDGADLVDENGTLAPVQELRVQKDILAWSREEGAVATMSFIDQSFSQMDVPANVVLCCADFNADGAVDTADLIIWRQAAAAGTTAGDADGDGDSDGFDFLEWQRWLGSSMLATTASATNSAAVPEPASGILLAGAAAIGLRRRSRRKQLAP
jgi:hypothetical protein